jgi:SAM-dependent methyltransferase
MMTKHDGLLSTYLVHDYSQEASHYDRVRFEKPRGKCLARIDAAIIGELLQAAGGSLLLDLPVGTGRALDYLNDQKLRIVGCDLTEGMLQVAKSRGPAVRVGVARCNAARLPFESSAFDAILSLRFFHLFPRDVRPLFVAEFARVLKPNGHLICSFTNGWYGGGINWVRKALGANTVHFLAPGELPSLFPGWRVRALRGNFLPLQHLFLGLGWPAEHLSRWLTSRPPFNGFCWERFYLLQRPG